MSSQYPLVSIIVITYNSGQFVVESLESVKAQTYQNIELIVSDDASQDNTVAFAKQWISENARRFVRTDVITVPDNTGVSANCNRSIAASQANWIKLLAGDDILLPNCIADNMFFIHEHPETRILFSQVELYKNQFTRDNFLRVLPQTVPMNIMNPTFHAADQFKLLLISDRINFTPSNFFHKRTIMEVGGFDENYKNIEDYPLWLKLTQAGYKLYFFEKATVGYRQHAMAMNNITEAVLIKPSVFKAYAFRKSFVHQYLPWDLVWSERFAMKINLLFEKFGWNTMAYRRLYFILSIYMNPFRYVSFFKKKLSKVDSVYYY